ncbi:FHA domain-containing protein [Roseimicrobium gellanilyticum]|uniref:FHA domain-containing protein n=1 Tax=Roseimicrobium gellanilyticum TaxID=748857 RepID=A0A366HI98_9BACT|nr:FHA domain-containing protein [Roseimicrobium gellanilyticum]RBP42487.1 FHA domain-containing protein [Roseimicrobium gellanilyticum]
MARLVFTLEDGTEIETELDSDVITIGRHADSIVVLPSASVSSHHATVKRRGDSYYVQDHGTTNGTKVNGVEVEEAKLEDGDQLSFGDVPAVVHLTDAPAIPTVTPLPSFSKLPPGAPALPPSSATSGVTVSSTKGSGRSAQQVAQMARTSGVRGRSPSYSRTVQYKESTGCAGFLTFLFFLLLAFLIGLHVRHGVVTGGFLLKDVLMKAREKTESGVEKHSEPEKPAEGAPAPSPAPAGGAAPAAPATPTPAPGAGNPAPATPAPVGGGAMMMDANN